MHGSVVESFPKQPQALWKGYVLGAWWLASAPLSRMKDAQYQQNSISHAVIDHIAVLGLDELARARYTTRLVGAHNLWGRFREGTRLLYGGEDRVKQALCRAGIALSQVGVMGIQVGLSLIAECVGEHYLCSSVGTP